MLVMLASGTLLASMAAWSEAWSVSAVLSFTFTVRFSAWAAQAVQSSRATIKPRLSGANSLFLRLLVPNGGGVTNCVITTYVFSKT